MRKLTIAMLMAVPLMSALAGSDAKALGHEPYPYCAFYGDGARGGGTNCGFDTMAQCRAALSGVGGICMENPVYPGPSKRRVNRR